MSHYFKYTLISLSILFLGLKPAYCENDSEKLNKLQRKKLVFLWPGMDCPDFKDTFDIYGFKIVCSGSVDPHSFNKNNKKVIIRLNRVYGKDWFSLNVKSFIHKK